MSDTSGWDGTSRPTADGPGRPPRGPAAGFVAVAAASVLLGCAAVLGSGPDPETLAGCYRFERNAGAEELRLPWGLLLRAEPLEEGWPLMERFDDVYTALTLESASRWIDHPFGYWRPVEGDSLQVGHPGGGGIVLVLAPREDGGLTGRGRDAGDAVRPGEDPSQRTSRSVRLDVVECGREDA